MTETSLKKLEQLIEAAPLPTKPSPDEDAFQSDGNDPSTPIQTTLTTEKLVETQIARRHALENVITGDEILRQRRLDELRDEYIPKLFWMMVGWLIFVAFCVVCVGLQWLTLTDAVVVALITTTTATVLGIFIIVAKWLFPAPPTKEK
jgi:hypothetical protein